LMGRRLYRFGHNMFGLAFVAGLVLWLGHRVIDRFPTMVGSPAGWLHAKLALVVLLVVYYVLTGRWLKNAAAGKPLASSRALRVFNELPVRVRLVVGWLVLAKPFGPRDRRGQPASTAGGPLPPERPVVVRGSVLALEPFRLRQFHRHAVGVAGAGRAQA